VSTYGYYDGRLWGNFVGHVDVHEDLGRVAAKVFNLLQLGSEAERRTGDDEEGSEQHGDAKSYVSLPSRSS
jgi:hypothetical protein